VTKEETNKKLIRRTQRLTQQLCTVLHKASPRSRKNLIASLAVDLGDIWAIGERFRAYLKQVQRMSFPRDGDKFGKLLARLEGDLLWETQYHLTSLERDLPKLHKDMKGGSNTRKGRRR
jgi:hypothetical protein